MKGIGAQGGKKKEGGIAKKLGERIKKNWKRRIGVGGGKESERLRELKKKILKYRCLCQPKPQTGTTEVCLLVFISFSWFMSSFMSYYCSIRILSWEENRWGSRSHSIQMNIVEGKET